jgi:outer membrane lipoprotein-sorting protein
MPSGIKGNRSSKAAACAALALLLALLGAGAYAQAAGGANPAAAPAAAGAYSLQQLMQAMAQVKTSRARFVEKKFLSIVNTPLEYTGGLAYNAPDRLEKFTQTPRQERMLLEGDKLTLENAKKQRRVVMLSEYPMVRAFTESIRSVLAGDLGSLQRFYKVSMEGSAEQWHLLLVPIEASMQGVVKEIRFEGSNLNGKPAIKTIEITEKQGDRSVMTITEVAS